MHHSINGRFAVRESSTKLILCSGSGGWSKEPTEGDVQLYDMSADIGERQPRRLAARRRPPAHRPAGSVRHARPQHPRQSPSERRPGPAGEEPCQAAQVAAKESPDKNLTLRAGLCLNVPPGGVVDVALREIQSKVRQFQDVGGQASAVNRVGRLLTGLCADCLGVAAATFRRSMCQAICRPSTT